MSSDLLVITLILIIVATNGAQFWYWSRICQALIDKVMSKNYAEFVQTKALDKSLSIPAGRTPFSAPLEEMTEEENDKILNELNGLLR